MTDIKTFRLNHPSGYLTEKINMLDFLALLNLIIKSLAIECDKQRAFLFLSLFLYSITWTGGHRLYLILLFPPLVDRIGGKIQIFPIWSR